MKVFAFCAGGHFWKRGVYTPFTLGYLGHFSSMLCVSRAPPLESIKLLTFS